MAWEYSEKTKQLFMDAVHGKPGTHLGEIEDPGRLGRARLDCLRRRHPFHLPGQSPSDGPHERYNHRCAISDVRLHLGHRRLRSALYFDRARRPHAHRGAEDHEQGHRGLSGGLAAAKDPLLGDGRGGPGSGRLQLGSKAGRRSAEFGRRHPCRRTAGRPDRLQVLLLERTIYPPQDQGAESPHDSRDHQRHQGGRSLHVLPSRSRRAARYAQRYLGR